MFDKEILKEKINENNLTYYQMAKKLNISTGHLSNLISGKIENPSFSLVCNISEILDSPIESFWIKEERNG